MARRKLHRSRQTGLLMILGLVCCVMAVSTLDPFTRHRSELTRQPSTQIDINTASVEELQLMPGIGVKTASDITADRERAGLFETADDLTRVKGIGERTVQRLRNSQLSRK